MDMRKYGGKKEERVRTDSSSKEAEDSLNSEDSEPMNSGKSSMASHGCCKQSRAVARREFSYWSIGLNRIREKREEKEMSPCLSGQESKKEEQVTHSKKSANRTASSCLKSYLSWRTSTKGHGLSCLIFFSSNLRLKNSEERRPFWQRRRGIGPRSSMNNAR